MYGVNSPHTFDYTVKSTPELANFEMGAKPSHVVVINKSNGAVLIWNNHIAANQGVALNSSADGMRGSDGITVVSDDVNLSEGFSLGTLTDFNDNPGEELAITAWPAL